MAPAKRAADTKSDALKKLYTYITTLIASCEVIPTAMPMPSYAELKSSPDKFYELFSSVTYNYNVVCDTLQKLQHSNAMIIKVLNDLMSPECSESYNVKNQYTKSFMSAKSECTALISAYETAKASSEAVVKFYNSAQYVICSHRFESTSATY